MAKVQFQVDGLDANTASIFNSDVTFDGNVDAASISIGGVDIFTAIPAGPEGPAGADGAQGPAGADGAQGPAGADGADGTTPDTSIFATLASPTFTGTVTVDGDITIDNNLYVGGTTTTTYSSTVSTRDNLIYLNQALDLLISGATHSGGTVEYKVDENSAIVIGMDVRVTGVTPSDYNISAADGIVIDSVRTSGGKNYFTVTKSVSVSYVSGGTAHLKTEANPDLGFAGGYYSGGYAHAGLFRDASDSGKFKLFQGYTPEPDEEVYIDTSHASFALAPISVSSIEATSATIGDVSNTELQYLNGVTSTIQTQINNKLNSTGSISMDGYITETATISATAAASTINYDLLTNKNILYYTSNSTGNWDLNIRGNNTTTLNSLMSIGQVLTLVFMVTNGSTAYYQTGLTIDGLSFTPKWLGQTAPTAGSPNSIDIYELTIIKTASNTYTVLESSSRFA
jgi:hypothetical protein